MPSRPWPLWLLTAGLLVGFPAVNFIYWPQILRSGVLTPDGDSIGIPMFGSIVATIALSPIVVGITWLSLRRYNPDTTLASWRPERSLRSTVLSLLFGTAALAFSAAVFDGLSGALRWYDYLWPAYFALWPAWFLALRAAAVDQLDYEPTYRGD